MNCRHRRNYSSFFWLVVLSLHLVVPHDSFAPNSHSKSKQEQRSSNVPSFILKLSSSSSSSMPPPSPSPGGLISYPKQPIPVQGLFGEQVPEKNPKNNKESYEWQIYIDQSKASLDKGGSATLDAFCSLLSTTPTTKVKIVPILFPKSSQSKKSPWIRCVPTKPSKKQGSSTTKRAAIATRKRNTIDVSSVDSVDKVYRILTKHLEIKV